MTQRNHSLRMENGRRYGRPKKRKVKIPTLAKPARMGTRREIQGGRALARSGPERSKVISHPSQEMGHKVPHTNIALIM
jgi:hypothetical protein